MRIDPFNPPRPGRLTRLVPMWLAVVVVGAAARVLVLHAGTLPPMIVVEPDSPRGASVEPRAPDGWEPAVAPVRPLADSEAALLRVGSPRPIERAEPEDIGLSG